MAIKTALYVSFIIGLLFILTATSVIDARVTTSYLDSQSVTLSQELEITVKSDRQLYCGNKTVEIYGNLTLAEGLVADGLIGLQIQTSQNRTLIIRTLSTGEPPSETPYVFISYVVPCDMNGTPKFSFRRRTLAFFKIEVTNLDIEPRDVLMTINTYYYDDTPFGTATFQASISAQSNPSFIIDVPIPADATLGAATVYANAYTGWPILAGTPYCSEVNSTFEITNSGSMINQVAHNPPASIQQTNQTANYNTEFRLPTKAPAGNFTVIVSSRYQGESAYNSTTFKVYKIGDLGGGLPPQFFEFDVKVDGKDLALFLLCFRKTAPLEAMELADLGGGLPPQFFEFDVKVDGKDLALFLLCFKGQGP
jgi:hypothetical protein